MLSLWAHGLAAILPDPRPGRWLHSLPSPVADKVVLGTVACLLLVYQDPRLHAEHQWHAESRGTSTFKCCALPSTPKCTCMMPRCHVGSAVHSHTHESVPA